MYRRNIVWPVLGVNMTNMLLTTSLDSIKEIPRPVHITSINLNMISVFVLVNS